MSFEMILDIEFNNGLFEFLEVINTCSSCNVPLNQWSEKLVIML